MVTELWKENLKFHQEAKKVRVSVRIVPATRRTWSLPEQEHRNMKGRFSQPPTFNRMF